MKIKLVDLHTHSLLSDGIFFPMELFRRVLVRGYKIIALADHVDTSNLDRVVPEIVKVAVEYNRRVKALQVIPAAEITQAPVASIAGLVAEARKAGAKLVVVHGETTVEPVEPGTNAAAIECGADVLAHPGLISEADFRLAKKRGVRLEISARQGHCLTNGHIVKLWWKFGGFLVLDTDGHDDGDFFTERKYLNVGLGAGLTIPELLEINKAAWAFAESKL